MADARNDIATAVAELRAAGRSWADVAAVLGTSKQQAHRTYGPKRPDVATLPLSDPLFDPLFIEPKR